MAGPIPLLGLLDELRDFANRRNMGQRMVGGGVRGAATRGLLGMDAPENATPIQREVYENAARMSAPAQGLTALKAATVFHGSPHKFTKFDPKKIGTGEGAQAYGHGLYVAESPEVAKSYQSALSAERGFSYGGKTGLTRAEVQDMVNAKYGSGYLDGVIRPSGVADSFIDDMVTGTERAKGAYPRQYKPGSQRAKIYDELRGQIQHADPGALYKIDLPDEAIARMLDWDKPISEQASILKRISPESMGLRYKLVDDGKKHAFVNADERIIGNIQEGGTPESFRANWMQSFMRPQMTGRQVYEELGGGMFGSDKAASALRQAGIPGIRYLDEQSRGRGQGTSNFVVFPGEEELLRILERNGVPIQSLLD